MRRVLCFLFLFGHAEGCASTAPGRGYVPEGGYPDTGVIGTTDGGTWLDAGRCPPMTFAGTKCQGITSCWQDCFSCLGNPPSFDKHDPLTYRCINGEYGTMGSVTCWNGRYKDNLCTMTVDGGK